RIQPSAGGGLPGERQSLNEFGLLRTEIGRPDCLLVPTAKSLDRDPPLPAANDVDHYACHRLSLATDGPPFERIGGVRVTDQFGTRYVDLTRPRHLCAPVRENGEGIKNPSGDFLCYHAELGPAAPLAGNPKVAAYNLADEPHVWDCPSAPQDLAARSALVKSLDPGTPTFAVIMAHWPENPYAPYVGTVDIIGADRYPCSWAKGCVFTDIDETIGLLETAKVPRYWAIVQA